MLVIMVLDVWRHLFDCLFGPQGKAQRRINAVHVMDALVLNGTDVRDQHFNQR